MDDRSIEGLRDTGQDTDILVKSLVFSRDSRND